MKHPVLNPDWPDLVKALYDHDMQEMWDPSILPHVYNCYHSELKRYFALAGDEPLHILDVGCAQGTLALLLAEAGHTVTAVDLRLDFLDYAQSRYETGNIEFIQGNALELSLPGEYDLIFANQILEHLIYPVDLIAGLSDMLVPGGRLAATTPNGRYVQCRLPSFRELGPLEKYEDRQFAPDGDAHFFAYTADELRDIFSEAGMEQVQVRLYATPWITGHMKFRHLHGKVPVPVLQWLDDCFLNIPGVQNRLAYQCMVCGRKPV